VFVLHELGKKRAKYTLNKVLKKAEKPVDNIVKKWNFPVMHILPTRYYGPIQALSGRL